jgi:photosystem II stability/assembly factor-like uncharacterized protein
MASGALRRRRERQASPTRRNVLLFGALALVAVALAGYWFFGRTNSTGAISKLETTDFHALAFSPDNPDLVFFGHHNGVMRSDDGGRKWHPLVERRNFDAMSLGVPGASPSRLFIAGHDVFQRSTDGGVSWQPVTHNLPGTDIHAFSISPDDANHLFAFIVGYGTYQSFDGGQTWTRLSDGLPPDVTSILAMGGTPETILVGSGGAGVTRSEDGGQSWARSNAGLSTPGVLALASDPSSRQKVYAGGPAGLYRSDDRGLNWTKLPFPAANVAAVAVSPARPDLVMAISASLREGQVYRSRDGGVTWDGRD